tara:strand:- start:2268 stop:2921 length:654 start_codon:yes stop_codon:yes gene_type:complete
MVQIPHGRGERRGPDAYVNQIESRNARVREIPVNDGWYVSTVDPYGADVTALTSDGSASTFNKFGLYLFTFPQLVRGVEVAKARVRITSAPGATRLIRFAIYRYDREHGQRAFRVVSGTEVRVTAGATGVIEKTLENPATLRVGSVYYLGINVGHQVGVACVENSANRLIPAFYDAAAFTSALSPMPAKIPLSQFSKEYEVNVPWVIYLSKLGAEIS